MGVDDGSGEVIATTAPMGSLSEIERMLMNDYGLADDSSAGQELPEPAPVKQHVHDITSLDGRNFSVDAWLEARKSLNLETLLQQQRTLRADIRRFRTNTQTLVHDNYSRFIAAADIIRMMRAEFEVMVVDTELLKSNMDGATVDSEAMNSRLQDKRTELAELAELQNLLQQLRAVRQMPASLRQLVAEKDYGSAVLLYSNAQTLLQAHGHIGLLRPISQEAHDIMQGTTEELMALLGKHDAEERSVAATVQMLRLLSVGSAEMQDAFVGGRQAHMQAALQAARLRAHAAIVTSSGDPSEAPGDDAPWPGLLPFLDSLCRSIFPTLSQLVSTYAAVFGSPGGDAHATDPRVRSLVDSTATAFISVAQWGLAAHAALAAAHSAPEHLAGATVASQQPGAAIAFQGDFGVAELTPALQYLHSAAAQHAEQVDAPQLLSDADALAAGAWRYCLGAAVCAVEQSVVNHMLRMLLTLPQGPQLPAGARDRLSAGIALAAAATTRSCDLLAATFLPAAAAGPTAMRDLPDLVQAELQRLLLSLKVRLAALACGAPDHSTTSVLATRASLGFTGRSFVSLQHNPLFPQSPTGRQSADGRLRMSLGERLSQEAALDVHAAPEPYECSAQVELPDPVPPLMCLVVHMVFMEVRTSVVVKVVESIAVHGAHQPQGTGVRDAPPFVAKAVQDQLATSAKRLLQQFVLRTIAPVEAAVKAAFSDEAFLQIDTDHVGPPRRWVSQACRVLLDVATEASALLPAGDPLPAALTPPALRRARGSSYDALDATDSSSQAIVQLSPGLFREQGRVHMPDITGTVFSVTLAACTHLLQAAVDTLTGQSVSPACIHQCQVDMLGIKRSIDLPQTLPFYQDIIATCESACTQSGPSLLDHQQLEQLLGKM